MLTRLANGLSVVAGKPVVTAVAFVFCGGWLASGLYFGFTNQLYEFVMANASSVVSIVMLFALQHSGNEAARIADERERALQLKIDELIASGAQASNRFIGLEEKSVEEGDQLRDELAQDIKP